jgi:hypothetical protein
MVASDCQNMNDLTQISFIRLEGELSVSRQNKKAETR